MPDINMAIKLCREAWKRRTGKARGEYAVAASTYLRERAEALGSPEAAEAAIALIEGEEQDTAAWHNEHGLALQTLARVSDDPDSYGGAIHAYHNAIAKLTGDDTALVSPVAAYRRAINHTLSSQSAFLGRIVVNLAAAWHMQATMSANALTNPKLASDLTTAKDLLHIVIASESVLDDLDRPRAQETLGNVLSVLGNSQEAIECFGRAAKGWGLLDNRRVDLVRTLSNIAANYVNLGDFAAARATCDNALKSLTRTEHPAVWSDVTYNRGRALLGLSTQPDAHTRELLTEAAKDFAAVRDQTQQSPATWSRATFHLVGTMAELGQHLLGKPSDIDRQEGRLCIYDALSTIYQSHQRLDLENKSYIVELIPVLEKVLKLELTGINYIHVVNTDDKLYSAALKLGYTYKTALDTLKREAAKTAYETTSCAKAKTRLPELPSGLDWPNDSFSEAHKRYGWDIVRYLDERWLPLLQAGLADRRMLAKRDPSAITAIKNYLRPHPVTGERRDWPDRLRFPARGDETKAKLATDPNSAFSDHKVAQSLTHRLRRQARLASSDL